MLQLDFWPSEQVEPTSRSHDDASHQLFISTRPERLLDPSIRLDEGFDCLHSVFPFLYQGMGAVARVKTFISGLGLSGIDKEYHSFIMSRLTARLTTQSYTLHRIF